MNKTEVQAVAAAASSPKRGSAKDTALVVVAVVLVLVGVVGFSFWSEKPMLLRVGLLLGGIVLGLVVGWFSEPGKRFIEFARDGYEESKRVTWPTREETLKTTGVVFLFVGVTAVFLFLVDKAVEKVIYDWVLGWK